jgi:hypothetical protein
MVLMEKEGMAVKPSVRYWCVIWQRFAGGEPRDGDYRVAQQVVSLGEPREIREGIATHGLRESEALAE